MAGARCVRYQYADDPSSDRSRVGREGRGCCPGPGSGRRSLGSGARAAGICAAQAVRTNEAETATQTQDRKNPRCPPDGCGRATTPVRLFWQRHLVSRGPQRALASWRAMVDEDQLMALIHVEKAS